MFIVNFSRDNDFQSHGEWILQMYNDGLCCMWITSNI